MARTPGTSAHPTLYARPEIEITLSDDGPLEAVGAAAHACALSNGFDAERATRLQVVVEELVRESLARDEAPIATGDVTTTMAFDGTTLEVMVVDHRLPLAEGQARHLPSRRLVSLGFVDKLHVGYTGPDGNVSTCALMLDADELDDVDHADLLGVGPSEDELAGIEIRPMTPADADSLVQCVFRCYGYSYPYQSMLKPKAIRRLLATGAMFSVVAVTATGEVVGHVACSFDRPGDTVPEAAKMIVDPRFRGHALAERLSVARVTMATQHGIPGMWSKAVTNHPASQRLAIQRGAAEVGLLIGASPASFKMSDLPDKGDIRRSVIVVFTPTGEIPSATLHAPAFAADHVADMCRRLGIDRTIATDSVEPTHRRTRLHSSAVATVGRLEIRVEQIGIDIVDRVMDVLDEYVVMQPVTTIIHLPGSDPSAAWATHELERIGFAWGALIPEFLATGDSVVLQRVFDHAMHLENVVCARREGEAVRDFVMAQWTRVRHGVAEGPSGAATPSPVR